jgi:hypothetical protein
MYACEAIWTRAGVATCPGIRAASTTILTGGVLAAADHTLTIHTREAVGTLASIPGNIVDAGALVLTRRAGTVVDVDLARRTAVTIEALAAEALALIRTG